MKLKGKDEITLSLINSLKNRSDFIEVSQDHKKEHNYYLNEGWIECLEWILGIEKLYDVDVDEQGPFITTNKSKE